MSNLKPSPMVNLLKEIQKWAEVYEFSFQFWGEGNNNVYIKKDNIELASFGGENTPSEIIEKALQWAMKQNPPRRAHKVLDGCSQRGEKEIRHIRQWCYCVSIDGNKNGTCAIRTDRIYGHRETYKTLVIKSNIK